MTKLPLFTSPSADPVQTLLELPSLTNAALRVGSVRLSPGQRVPAEGHSQHHVAEVSLILAGSLAGESGDRPFHAAAGELTLIPAQEAHWAVAGEQGADILWMWFGDLSQAS